PNGFVGVGWSLTGFSVIQRASKRRGAPAYNAGDIYLLDGQELVPCASGSLSPSCTTGGSHSTKIESYQRHQFDPGSNTRTVWDRTGTASTYRALQSAQQTVCVPTCKSCTVCNTCSVSCGCDKFGNCTPCTVTDCTQCGSSVVTSCDACGSGAPICTVAQLGV